MGAKAFIAILGAWVVSLAIFGCGGGSSDPLTKKQFQNQANAICLKADKERDAALSAAAKKGSDGSPEQELGTYVDQLALPPIQTMIEELEDLDPPEGQEKKVEALIGEFTAAVAKLESKPEVALGGNPFEEANAAAESYGIPDCTL